MIRDYDLYKSVYCALCKSLGKNFGPISRLLLSYDATFLAMFGIALSNQKISFISTKCTVNPLKKCKYYELGKEELIFSAAVSVIMAFYKIKDDIRDSKFLTKFKGRIKKLLFFKSYKKAIKLYPDLDQIVSRYEAEQLKVEDEKEKSIDISAYPTSKAVSEIFSLVASKNNNTQHENIRIIKQFGLFLGRWIYLIDAFDDIEKDISQNNYNPFLYSFQESSDLSSSCTYCNQVLNHTLSNAISAFNLLKISKFNRLFENILFRSMPIQQKAITCRIKNKNLNKKLK